MNPREPKYEADPRWRRQSLSRGLFLLLRVAAALVLTICAAAPPAGAESQKLLVQEMLRQGKIRTVVAFGDSVTSGYLDPQGWPEVLERRLKERFGSVTVINAGRPGDTSADGLDRLAADALSRKPDLVLVAFGLNDMKEEVPPRLFRSHLETLVQRIRETGAQVALLTTTRMVMGSITLLRLSPEPYNREIREVAAKRQVYLVDVFAATAGKNRKKLYRDLVHPNRQGYELLGEIIARAICD